MLYSLSEVESSVSQAYFGSSDHRLSSVQVPLKTLLDRIIYEVISEHKCAHLCPVGVKSKHRYLKDSVVIFKVMFCLIASILTIWTSVMEHNVWRKTQKSSSKLG